MESVPEKVCPDCGQAKLLTNEFWGNDKSRPDRFTRCCKECTNATARVRSLKWRRENPEKVTQYGAISAQRVRKRREIDPMYDAQLKEKAREQSALRRAANPEYFRAQAKKTREKTPKHVLYARSAASMHKAKCREYGVATYAEVLALKQQMRESRKADDQAMQAFRKEDAETRLSSIIARLERYMAPLIREDDRKRKAAENRRLRASLKARDPQRYTALNRARKQRRRARERGAEGSFDYKDVEKLWQLQHGKCYYCGAPLKRTGDAQERFHVEHFLPLSLGGTNYPSNLVLACPPCNSTKSGLPPEEFLNSIGRLL